MVQPYFTVEGFFFLFLKSLFLSNSLTSLYRNPNSASLHPSTPFKPLPLLPHHLQTSIKIFFHHFILCSMGTLFFPLLCPPYLHCLIPSFISNRPYHQLNLFRIEEMVHKNLLEVLVGLLVARGLWCSILLSTRLARYSERVKMIGLDHLPFHLISSFIYS